MRTQKNLKDILVILILLILITIFFPVAILQKTFITTGLIQSDLMNHSYPLKATYGDALKKGKLLLWSSLISNGYPVFAEGQTGGLYPINLLLFKFLPNLQAYNYSLLIHYFLAAFFTYLFGRKILKLGRVPGLLAALTYAFSGFFITHLVHPAMIQVASFIPLNFFLLEKLIQATYHKQLTINYITALAIVFALQVLAGHHELLYFIIVFLFIYLFIRNLQIHKKKFIRPFLASNFLFLISGFLALGLSAIQILPTLELVKFSTRKIGLSYQKATSYLFPFCHLLTFLKPKTFSFSQNAGFSSFTPDLTNLWETYGYVGIIPLTLAGFIIVREIFNMVRQRYKKEIGKLGNWEITPLRSFGASKGQGNGKKVNFTSTFTVLFILSLLLALGRATPFFKLFWLVVPGMKFFKYPTRFLVFTEFSLAILAGIGLEKLGIRVWGIGRKAPRAQSPEGAKPRGRKAPMGPRPFSGGRAPFWGAAPLFGGPRPFSGVRVKNFLSKKASHYTLYPIPYALFILTFLDLLIHNRSINPTTDPKTWFQPPSTASFLSQNLGHNRFHTLRTTPFDYSLIEDLGAQLELKNLLPANFNLLYGLRQTDALAGLFLSRHTQLNQETPHSILSLDLDKDTFIPPPACMRIISLQAAKFLLSPIPFKHPALKLVKTIPLAKPLTFNIYLLTKSGQKHKRIPVTNTYIYENSQSFPRAFIVPNSFITSENEQGILKLLSTSEINFKETVLLEEQVGGDRSEGTGRRGQVGGNEDETKVKIIEDTNEKVVINTRSEGSGFLVLADTFYPGWRAFVDDLPTKIYRANFNFRAVVLPKGEHKVEFIYKPLSFRIGGIITLITGGSIILFLVSRKRVKIKISNF